MRVTHVITRLIVGGAQENTVSSVLGLRRKPGIQVSLISGPSEGKEGTLKGELAQCPGLLEVIPELVRPVHPWKDCLAFRRLIRKFRADRPDIVHTHSGKAGVVGRLAAARAGVPIIIHTIHGPSFGAFQGWLGNLLFRSAEKYAAGVTTHFVVVADAMRDQYISAGIGRPGQYTRIFSGFDLEPFLHASNDPELRAKLGFEGEDIIVGKIARLFKLKGHDDLLSIAPAVIRACPKVRFLLVGDGPWRERLEAKARELGLTGHFVFAGLVPPNEVSRYVGIMDVLIHLSRREGLARALPQALAAGRPVGAYDCDGAREVCLENQTGFLVRPGDQATLLDRMVRLVQDKSLRQRLGQRGQQFVRERFSVERMVNELHELYLRLAAQRGSTAQAKGI